MKKSSRLFIRRCHLCSKVTEAEAAPVERCENCGKSMAPFYFFDDLAVPALSDREVRPQAGSEPGQRLPIRGFTAYW